MLQPRRGAGAGCSTPRHATPSAAAAAAAAACSASGRRLEQPPPPFGSVATRTRARTSCMLGMSSAMLNTRMADTEFMKGSVEMAARRSPTLNLQARAGSLKRKRKSSEPSSMDHSRALESPAADSSTLESSAGRARRRRQRRAQASMSSRWQQRQACSGGGPSSRVGCLIASPARRLTGHVHGPHHAIVAVKAARAHAIVRPPQVDIAVLRPRQAEHSAGQSERPCSFQVAGVSCATRRA